MFVWAPAKAAVFFLIGFAISVRNATGAIPNGPSMRQPTVTNNDIRDAILQIVNVERNTEDKLERHEYRERVLGEQLKRGLISIDKRIKQMEHLKGAVTRLDERLAAVETILMQKEERERAHAQRSEEQLEDLNKSLPALLEKIKKDIVEEISKQRKIVPPPPPSLPPKPLDFAKDLEKLRDQIGEKLDRLNGSLDDIGRNFKSGNECKTVNKKTSENLDKLRSHLENGDRLLDRYEQKLMEFNVRPEEPPAQIKEQADWQINFLKSLENQKQTIGEVLSNLRNISNDVKSLPNNAEVKQACKTEEIVDQINRNTDGRAKLIVDAFDKKIDDSTKNHEEVAQELKSLANKTDRLIGAFDDNAERVGKDLQAIKKVDEVMVQTADSVLDTKRRVEYGVHQIMAEVAQLIKQSTKDISNSLGDRFEVFEQSMIDEDNGAIANLTSKIGGEIDQVWRQIGMMHQKMNSNADILAHLQNQTDAYVNGSSNVMDNMKGKVAKITKKIVDLDENLNYLMGRLMLVSREFNQIKTGLSKALEEIKGTFHEVQSKIKDSGPGPHKIESSEQVDDVTPQRKRRSPRRTV